MRAVSLVDRLEFDFIGGVLKNAMTFGDVDNDGENELVVGSDRGEVFIYKGHNRWQNFKGLGFVTCLAVGDVLNKGRNCLVVITADGWCHIYSNMYRPCKEAAAQETEPSEAPLGELKSRPDALEGFDKVDGQGPSTSSATSGSEPKRKSSRTSNRFKFNEKLMLNRVHTQRIPANTKVVLTGDIDGDGFIELVLGLTDRVVRSYRWIDTDDGNRLTSSIEPVTLKGKLVGLNKWECANQIGSVTLHHLADGMPCLLVAQPGGTFMRIKCKADDLDVETAENEESENSENADKTSLTLAASLVDYQFLGLSRMRNQNISTEIVGDFISSQTDKDTPLPEKSLDVKSTPTSQSGWSMTQSEPNGKGNAYAVATLDGTIMLVQDEIILWAMAVDHQVFALNKLDFTGNGLDDIVACSWDGQTYILDQDKNSMRFHLDESVQAFCSGMYSVVPGEKPCPCLVYVTFHNKMYIYYDIPLKNIVVKKFEPDLTKYGDVKVEGVPIKDLDRNSKKELVDFLLYSGNVSRDVDNNY